MKGLILSLTLLSAVEAFIRNKYEKKLYIMKDGEPQPNPTSKLDRLKETTDSSEKENKVSQNSFLYFVKSKNISSKNRLYWHNMLTTINNKTKTRKGKEGEKWQYSFLFNLISNITGRKNKECLDI